jgi:hypothetical protein
MKEATCRLLPLEQFRRNHRSILGTVELMAARFVITDTPGVIGELRQLTKAAKWFLTGTDAQPSEAASPFSPDEGKAPAVAKMEPSDSPSDFQLLPLTQLKRARRALLGRIEHAGIRFIVTDYGQAVAELGPLSKSARQALARLEEERRNRRRQARRANGEANAHPSGRVSPTSTREAGRVRERGYAR